MRYTGCGFYCPLHTGLAYGPVVLDLCPVARSSERLWEKEEMLGSDLVAGRLVVEEGTAEVCRNLLICSGEHSLLQCLELHARRNQAC